MPLPTCTERELLTSAEDGHYQIVDRGGKIVTEHKKDYLAAEDRWFEGLWELHGHVSDGKELPMGVELACFRADGKRVLIGWTLATVEAAK